VTDATAHTIAADITLDEPLALKVSAAPYTYPGGLNISCYNCYNGSITPSVLQGVAPYSYLWSDGSTAPVRTNLGSASYGVTVTDANGCEASAESMFLQEPERSDWTMTGNAGTNPAVQYIGTSDNKDVVFKANGQEAVRLKGDGGISLMGSLVGEGVLVRGADGKLRLAGEQHLPTLPVGTPCRSVDFFPYWETRGNTFSELCPEVDPLLGTLGAKPLKIVTNGLERMRITPSGAVAIGATSAPETKLHVQGDMLVRDTHGDIITNSNATTGVAIWARNNGAAWGLSIDPDGKGHIVGDWNNPHPIMTFAYDKVGIGTDNMPGDDYSLFVGKGLLAERVKVALQTSLDWSDHVFAPGYKLMPLSEVGCYITAHGHLPGVPSATEMVQSGLDVVKTDAMLLEKIEEMVLHLIQMNARISDLEVENARLTRALLQPTH